MRKISILFILSLAVFLFSSDNCFTQESVEHFKNLLEDQGFTVQEGSLYLFNPADLFGNYILPSCFCNNADSPYAVYLIPEGPGQVSPNKYPWTYKLKENEAIIYLGWTPPPMVYFSYQTFIAGRFYNDVFHRIFGNLGDTINISTINTGESIKEETKGTKFNAPTIIISTPDRNTDAVLRAEIARAGFDVGIVNTEVLPSALLRLGLERDDDELTFLFRAAFFENEADREFYTSDPPLVGYKEILVKPPYQSNFRGWVFRVTPPEDLKSDPFPIPPLRIRATGDTSELELAKTMDRLREAILKEYEGLQFSELKSYRWFEESYHGIQTITDVFGETRDTVYFRTDTFELSESGEDFVIVYGPIHSLTGKSIYSSFILYTGDIVKDLLPLQSRIMLGFLSVNSQMSEESKLGLKGSAKRFLPDDPNADLFYVWKIARTNPNNEDYCVIVPEPNYERITYNELFVAFRAYIDPKLAVSAAYEEILMDKVIYFSQEK